MEDGADGPDAAAVAMLARLADGLGVAARPHALEDELGAAVARVREVFGAGACSFARVEDETTLRFVAADGAGAEAILGVTLPVGRGIAGWVALAGEPIQVGNVTQDSRFARDVAEATSYLPTTILAAPVVDRHGEVQGVVEVLDPAGGPGSERNLPMLGLVADQLAAVVRLAATYDALGTALLRGLADPQDTGAFDDSLRGLVETTSGPDLAALAREFRRIVDADAGAAALATAILEQVADFLAERR